MKLSKCIFATAPLAASGLLTLSALAEPGPYKILQTNQVAGTGRIDYVYADNNMRRVYVPRGSEVLVFDEDSLAAVGTITNTRAHGVAVDHKAQHGFSSSSPVTMWDSQTLEVIKTIPVEGRPDSIVYEPFTEQIYVLSHAKPNATVLNGKDGAILGTLDLGGEPEQAVADGQGHLYIALEDKDSVAVVDASMMKLTATYSLGGKGAGPSGLALDRQNNILFAFCHEPPVAVVLSATDGKTITTLPIGKGNDSGCFNSNTMEAFSSQGDGTLTVIKENSPTNFVVEQTVATKARAKTCTLDTKNNRVIVITLELQPVAATNAVPASLAPGTPGAEMRGRGQRGGGLSDGPGTLDIMTIGHPDLN